MDKSAPKPILWIGSSKRDLREFPNDPRAEVGRALNVAQFGGRSGNVKMLRGFGGGNMLEVVEDYDTDTYRAIYTVRFARAIVVLHAFQKKSKRGGQMTQQDKELIQHRLRDARDVYEEWLGQQGEEQ